MTWARPSEAERRQAREQEKNRNMRALVDCAAVARGTYAGTTSGTPVAKEQMLQHAGYEKAVRGLGYCMLCRRACRPQFCHADMGKGTGIKTDCRRGWPGCAKCHWKVGTSGQYPKEQRRALEADLAWRTRQAVLAAGTWPARLPAWEDS